MRILKNVAETEISLSRQSETHEKFEPNRLSRSIVKGTTKGTSSDFNGHFELSNVKTGDVLVFSFIGFTDNSHCLKVFTASSIIPVQVTR